MNDSRRNDVGTYHRFPHCWGWSNPVGNIQGTHSSGVKHMPEEQIIIKKERGQCDNCNRFTWVITQYLGSTPVAAYCKTCNPKENDGDE